MVVTKEQVLAIMPEAKGVVDLFLPTLNKYSEDMGINTPMRMAHFLAQTAVESNQWRRTEENLNYSAKGLMATWPSRFKTNEIAVRYARKPVLIANKVYANRMGNGDESSDDGWKYRGRGLIQLTGRDQYAKYKGFCGFDVVEKPELLAAPVGAMRSAMWYWWKNGLSAVADTDNVLVMTKRINGGTHGLEERKKFTALAKKVFKV